MKNIPIYELIDNDMVDGVDCISLVESPAIEVDFLKFNKIKPIEYNFSKEEKIVFGPVMIPELPIYRESADRGPHYVKFSKKTIKALCKKYFKNEYQRNWNTNHSISVDENDCYVYQSFITDKKMGITPPKGFEDIADGTWFMTLKIESDELWSQVLDGTFRGFSVEVESMYKEMFSSQQSEDMMELEAFKQLYRDLCNYK